ncbi:MAG TPA: hypothetical protein VES66_08040 [Terriglobales bacterium]|nr:hypothetical protein [Terriglobales bacterium]
MTQKFSLPMEAVVLQKHVNLQQLLEDFLNTPPDRLLAFLERFGGVGRVWDGGDQRDRDWPALLAQWQTRIRGLALLEDWSSQEARLSVGGRVVGQPEGYYRYVTRTKLFEHKLRLRFAGGYWSAEVPVTSLLEALLLAVVVGKIQGNEVVLCGRKGCDQVFRARGGKTYHDAECAHLQSVADGRKKKRESLAAFAAAELNKQRAAAGWHLDVQLKEKLARKLSRDAKRITAKWVTRNRALITRLRRCRQER